MAEAAGVAIGVVGLAGLFGQAVQCLNMIQLGRAQDHDAKIVHQKLDNQRARFFIWGESVSLNDPSSQSTIDERELISSNVRKTMELVIALCENGDWLTSRYGLVVEQTDPTNTQNIVGGDQRPFRRIFDRFSRMSYRSKDTGTAHKSGVTRWVIQDRSRFIELVGHLRDLVDDLESLSTSIEAVRRRARIVRYEIESLSEQELELVEDARWPFGDLISDAASLRLESLGHSSYRSIEGSIRSRDTLRTAPELGPVDDSEMLAQQLASVDMIVNGVAMSERAGSESKITSSAQIRDHSQLTNSRQYKAARNTYERVRFLKAPGEKMWHNASKLCPDVWNVPDTYDWDKLDETDYQGEQDDFYMTWRELEKRRKIKKRYGQAEWDQDELQIDRFERKNARVMPFLNLRKKTHQLLIDRFEQKNTPVMSFLSLRKKTHQLLIDTLLDGRRAREHDPEAKWVLIDIHSFSSKGIETEIHVTLRRHGT